MDSMQNQVKTWTLQMAEKLEKDPAEIEVELKTTINSLNRLKGKMSPERLLVKAMDLTEDILYTHGDSGDFGIDVEGFILGVTRPSDGTAKRRNAILDTCNVVLGEEKCIEDGTLKLIDGQRVVIDTQEFYTYKGGKPVIGKDGAAVKNPNFQKALLPNWSFEAILVGAVGDKIKQTSMKFKGEHADPASPKFLYYKLQGLVFQPLKFTKVFLNEAKSDDKHHVMTFSKVSDVIAMPKRGENLVEPFITLQHRQGVIDQWRIITLAQVPEFFEKYASKGYNVWALVGFPQQQDEKLYVRATTMFLKGDTDKTKAGRLQDHTVRIRDGSLEKKAGVYSQLKIPQSMPITFAKGSELLSCVTMYQYERDGEKSDVQLNCLGYGVSFNTAPSEKPEAVDSSTIKLDGL